MFALSATVASSAFALEWKLNKEAIKVATKTKSEGKLTLQDKGAKVKIECEGTDEGTVGPGVKDELTAAKASKCKTLEGTCEEPTAEPLGLPWKTSLVAGPRDEIEGKPGWKVVCKIAGIFKITDECTGATSTGISNVAGGVDATFEEKSKNANCTVGGEGQGVVRGTDLIKSPESGKLTVE
ncbi:MAG: hypothetical protein ABSB69_02625 [Solirubrobacteraceae bacterium]